MKGQSAAKSLNGQQFGVLKVISDRIPVKGRGCYNTLCTRCNKETIVRGDHLQKSPKACRHCVNSLQKEIADTKYKKLRKYKRIYNSYRGNAYTRNIKFDITLQDVISLVDSECYYCGDNNSKGIDRIDSKDFYHINNVVPCCGTCNMMKNKFTTDLFLEKVNQIYNKHLKKGSTTIPKGSTPKQVEKESTQ